MTHATRSAAILAALIGLGSPVQGQTPGAVRLIQVEPDVKLEVLDWGGAGRPVVLLAGNGRTAHDFEGFASKLATSNHVYGVTRRGSGASSAPPTGYSADRLADDVLAVIDSLALIAPVLAGHSLAGEELSSIGSPHPERVAGLVYLDAAYDYAFYDSTVGRSFYGNELIDMNEVRRGLEQLVVAARKGAVADVHLVASRLLDTDLPALARMLRDIDRRAAAAPPGSPPGLMMSPDKGTQRLIFEGLQRHTAVRAPILAIFALKGAKDSVVREWQSGRTHEILALKRAAPSARILILPEASHDLFRSNEADALREMRSFIATLPASPPAGR